MAKHRSDLTKGSVLPSTWVNALMEFISTGSSNVLLEKATNTSVRIVAGTVDDQVGIGIDGAWRYISSTVTATHPGGAAGTHPVWVTASANDFSAADPADNTNYSFALQITTGAAPATALYRQIGTVVWDGAAITEVRQSVQGPLAGQQALGALTGVYPAPGFNLPTINVGAYLGGRTYNSATGSQTNTNAWGGTETSVRIDIPTGKTALVHARGRANTWGTAVPTYQMNAGILIKDSNNSTVIEQPPTSQASINTDPRCSSHTKTAANGVTDGAWLLPEAFYIVTAGTRYFHLAFLKDAAGGDLAFSAREISVQVLALW